jgi:Co/Zn/Cd efflux system component
LMYIAAIFTWWCINFSKIINACFLKYTTTRQTGHFTALLQTHVTIFGPSGTKQLIILARFTIRHTLIVLSCLCASGAVNNFCTSQQIFTQTGMKVVTMYSLISCQTVWTSNSGALLA